MTLISDIKIVHPCNLTHDNKNYEDCIHIWFVKVSQEDFQLKYIKLHADTNCFNQQLQSKSISSFNLQYQDMCVKIG